MTDTTGYVQLDGGTRVGYSVKLFNALYGTDHMTFSEVWPDLRNLFNERIAGSQTGVFTQVFNLVQIIVGFVYITDCPFEPMIPICLVVAGFIKLFKDTVALVRWRSEVNYIRANAAKPEGNIESPLYRHTHSAAYTLLLWLTWLFIYVWLVISAVYLFKTLAAIMRTSLSETASVNIKKHGGFHFQPGVRTTVYRAEPGHSDLQPHSEIVPANVCSNTILLFAFFIIAFRLALLAMNTFVMLSITCCGLLAIVGAEAEGLINTTDTKEESDETAS